MALQRNFLIHLKRGAMQQVRATKHFEKSAGAPTRRQIFRWAMDMRRGTIQMVRAIDDALKYDSAKPPPPRQRRRGHKGKRWSRRRGPTSIR